MLSEKELTRYSRSLPIIGKEGQEKLKKASVLVVGAGGLGSSAAIYLAASGVGTLGILDFDKVEESNLQRQILHGEGDTGKEKTLSAKQTLETLNPHTKIKVHQEHLSEENVSEILKQYDIILDCSDSLETKHLVNSTCHKLGKTLVYGAAVGKEGQLAVFKPEGPCLACLLKAEKAPTCSSEGVLPIAPGVIGILQASEAIKLALGQKPIEGLMVFNTDQTRFKIFSFKKNPSCPTCSKNPEKPKENKREITPKELKQLVEKGEVQLIDVREPFEREASKIEGSLSIPMNELESSLGKLDKNKLIVTYCQSGIRSLEAQKFLEKKGFRSKSLKGGLVAWFSFLQ